MAAHIEHSSSKTTLPSDKRNTMGQRNTMEHARCRRCAYPLRNLLSNRCPECGDGFDPADPYSFIIDDPAIRWRAWTAAGLVTVWFSSLVLLLLINGTNEWPRPYRIPISMFLVTMGLSVLSVLLVGAVFYRWPARHRIWLGLSVVITVWQVTWMVTRFIDGDISLN